MQFQRRGEVITVPFTFRVAEIWDDPAPVANASRRVQRATIQVDNGVYSPANLTVTSGKPVEFTFIGGKAMGCGASLVFPDLGIKKQLAPGKKTVVTFMPKKSGPLRFTCAMNMYQGRVTVK